MNLSKLLACAAVVSASAAHAQQAPSAPSATPRPGAPSKAAPKTVEGVTVTGSTQGFRSSIDRRSYGVANDLTTTTGSIGDALKNIPSVEVDVNGNVSLRGDTNVTILVDGKPSAMFRGASAAQALQSMPANAIERVEVITNPSAQFSPEGTAGVINLITRQVRRPGKSGSLRVNLGHDGRANGGVTGAYNSNKLTVTGDAGARREPQNVRVFDQRDLLDGQGRELQSSTTQVLSKSIISQWNVRTSVDYDLNAATRLSGEIRYNHIGVDAHGDQRFDGRSPAGAPVLAFGEHTELDQSRGNGSVQASLRRKFAGDDHVLTVNVSRERTDESRDQTLNQTLTLPVAPTFFTSLHSENTLTLTQAKADYSRPLAGEAKLKAGYDLRIDENRYDNVGLRGTGSADAAPDPTQTNLFLYKQTINAAYATYERPFGEWTVLGGVRLEAAQLDLDQVTSHLTHDTDNVRAYPSLHLAYRFADDKQLILSYSKRVQRPNPQDLNPFRVERDPLNFSAGNPNLRPQLTDSYEAGYQYRSGATFYLATLYYRHNEHGVTDVITDLGNGVLLTTKENLTESQAAGLELVANGRLTKTLSFNVSTNLYWNQIDATGQGLDRLIGFAGSRSAFAVGGRASLTWQVTPKDVLQFNAQETAKRLTPQGFNDPYLLTFLGYRHKFNDSLSAVVTAQDVFNTFKIHNVVDAPTLHDRVTVRPNIRAVFVGLTWNFGAPNRRGREPLFDFGGGGAPSP